MYVCIYMYVMYICMCVYIYVCNVCMCVCMCVCVCVCVCVYGFIRALNTSSSWLIHLDDDACNARRNVRIASTRDAL